MHRFIGLSLFLYRLIDSFPSASVVRFAAILASATSSGTPESKCLRRDRNRSREVGDLGTIARWDTGGVTIDRLSILLVTLHGLRRTLLLKIVTLVSRAWRRPWRESDSRGQRRSPRWRRSSTEGAPWSLSWPQGRSRWRPSRSKRPSRRLHVVMCSKCDVLTMLCVLHSRS